MVTIDNTERAAEPKSPLTGVPEVLLAIFGLVAAIVLSGLFGVTAQAALRRRNTEATDLRVLLLGQVGFWVGLVVTALVVSRMRSSTVRARYSLTMRANDLWWTLLGPVLQFFISVAYKPFVDRSKLEAPAKELVATASGHAGWFLVLAMFTVFGAPLVEELFFRGVLLQALLRRESTGKFKVFVQRMPMLLSGLVFAAIHFQPLQFPALFFFGLVAAILAVRYERLGPSIWLHVGFNATTMVLLGRQLVF